MTGCYQDRLCFREGLSPDIGTVTTNNLLFTLTRVIYLWLNRLVKEVGRKHITNFLTNRLIHKYIFTGHCVTWE